MYYQSNTAAALQFPLHGYELRRTYSFVLSLIP